MVPQKVFKGNKINKIKLKLIFSLFPGSRRVGLTNLSSCVNISDNNKRMND